MEGFSGTGCGTVEAGGTGGIMVGDVLYDGAYDGAYEGEYEGALMLGMLG